VKVKMHVSIFIYILLLHLNGCQNVKLLNNIFLQKYYLMLSINCLYNKKKNKIGVIIYKSILL